MRGCRVTVEHARTMSNEKNIIIIYKFIILYYIGLALEDSLLLAYRCKYFLFVVVCI